MGLTSWVSSTNTGESSEGLDWRLPNGFLIVRKLVENLDLRG